MEKIREAGFNISLSSETNLTKEMAEQLYSEHKGKDFFEDLTGLMSKWVHKIHRNLLAGSITTYLSSLLSGGSGPSLFMVLSREDAVSGWRALMGPPDPDEAKKENPNS